MYCEPPTLWESITHGLLENRPISLMSLPPQKILHLHKGCSFAPCLITGGYHENSWLSMVIPIKTR